ncbi:hypothetical protein ARMGADRAFT_544266 [Armillaria gallica]|uniref:Uncharacterized protein n=1 Tax=Armillaria gallica TaxID=47427 RepID=A0A2H3CWF6_ARMGA|nr:hypothetical protein ARMGADRAFT_544266 [Armillaria gallica]
MPARRRRRYLHFYRMQLVLEGRLGRGLIITSTGHAESSVIRTLSRVTFFAQDRTHEIFMFPGLFVCIMVSSSYDNLSPIPISQTHRRIQTRRSCRISTRLRQPKPARTVKTAARSFDSLPLESTLTSHIPMAMISNIFHGDDVSATYCLSIGSTMRVPGCSHTRIYQEA